MKLYLAITLLTFSIMSFAQNSMFEKYEDLDDVSTVVVTKHAFKLMGKVASDSPEAQSYKDMVNNLDYLAVYTTEDDAISKKMLLDVQKYLESTKLSELMRVKDKDANVKIYVKEGEDEDHVSELFMYITNLKDKVNINGRKPEVVIVSLTGNIDLNKIGELTDKMNIPGGEHLKEAGKK
ncbi:MAG TPA: DUF4252 domain-containing protein [Flavobacteriia bacterium]|nr:DUF4252 domain-containing protein [Flavobacteriia bacterium]